MNITKKLNHHFYGAKLCKELYNNNHNDNKKKTSIVHNKESNTTYICIKGTSSVKDWKQNINLKLNQRNIHTGFDEYARECKEELDFGNGLLSYFDTTKNIVLSCHSLGASACLITMLDFLLSNDKDILHFTSIDLVLLGCPKTGGSTFSSQWQEILDNHDNINIYRYVTKNDIVPMYPPLKEYVHLENEILLDFHDKNMNAYKAHSIDTYIYNLKNKALKNTQVTIN